ncbi:hypothetical protein NADFUDRAFT_41958 [Nadsonia fulvescens var. elongata DSM 6958]|uniref:Uncharacterized protein n=1 Tax=Nadsonia fulvescens var. elongata DSM 6958 TaxID=857566 RepID=A0A1E3PKM2_9ASCO|nr:hypothetical protein NADFUDRAFT_41958 [Nadsonia fulvescens var. elongata DSM 6958]
MADKLAYTSMKKARDIYHQANCFIPKDFDLTTLSYQDILNLLKNGLFSSTRSLHRLNSSETNHNGIILEDDGDISTEDSMLQKTLKNSVDFEGLLKKSKEIYIDLTQKETSVEFELIVISDDEADIELIDSKDFQNCINKDNSDVICLGNNARKFVPITDGFEIFD